VTFIDNDGVPIIGAAPCDEVTRAYTVNGAKYVVVAPRVGAVPQHFTKGVVAQYFAISSPSLRKNLLTVRDEE
jgi:hypothetical protein